MISTVPLDRWDPDLVQGATVGGRFGGFVQDWASFDAHIFSVSPSEAAYMDPSQRVLLEVCHLNNCTYLSKCLVCQPMTYLLHISIITSDLLTIKAIISVSCPV